MRSYNIFLNDQSELNYLKMFFSKINSRILEIGPGEGAITKNLPKRGLKHILVEPNQKRFKKILDKLNENSEFEINWAKIQDLKSCPSDVKTIVSNLPYNQAIKILAHCAFFFPSVENYYVILQEEVYDSMADPKKLLYFKMTHLFDVKKIKIISKKSFSPEPKVNGVFLHLKPKVFINWDFYAFLKSLTQPRKKIRKMVSNWTDDKRICEHTPLSLYNAWKELRT